MSDSFMSLWTTRFFYLEFSRQEYWSRLPFPISRRSSHPRDRTYVSCISGRLFTTEPPGDDPMDQDPLSMGFPGKNTGVGSHTFHQEIFLNQWSNPCLLNYRILYHLSHQGSQKVVALCLKYCVKVQYLILYYSVWFNLLILFFSFYNFT